MRVMVCYATTDGQTRKIAEYIAGVVRDKGHEATVFDATSAGGADPSDYQAAIVAGSVHMGRYQTALVHQVRRWREALNAMPSAFISVSLSATSDDPHVRAEIDECAQHMFHETGWNPNVVLHAAGAIRFSEYDFFRRWMAWLIAVQMGKGAAPLSDQEYTDWDSVERFVERFLAAR